MSANAVKLEDLAESLEAVRSDTEGSRFSALAQEAIKSAEAQMSKFDRDVHLVRQFEQAIPNSWRYASPSVRKQIVDMMSAIPETIQVAWADYSRTAGFLSAPLDQKLHSTVMRLATALLDLSNAVSRAVADQERMVAAIYADPKTMKLIEEGRKRAKAAFAEGKGTTYATPEEFFRRFGHE